MRQCTSTWTAPRLRGPAWTPENDARGFTLIEVLIAAAVLGIAVVATAALIVTASRSLAVARAQTWAAFLALDKIEEFRVRPQSLVVTSAAALQQDTPAAFDYLDADGAIVAAASNATYVRRWSIQPLPARPMQAWVVQTLVMPAAFRSTTSQRPGTLPGAALMCTVVSRRDE